MIFYEAPDIGKGFYIYSHLLRANACELQLLFIKSRYRWKSICFGYDGVLMLGKDFNIEKHRNEVLFFADTFGLTIEDLQLLGGQ